MMRKRTPLIAALVVLASASAVQATTATPAILMTKANKVPVCTTPERLMAFVAGRNKAMPAKLHEIAGDYKRHGQELNVRWDYAFFQMIVETNWLRFYAPGGKPGDVSPNQNNFAGLGATGRRAPGESFASVDSGVLAHLQHVRLYSGEPVENPVAERTKLVTDLILPWAQSLKRPVTYTDLTRKWAPSGHSYSDAIENVARIFREGYCTGKAADVPADETANADTAGADVQEAAAGPAVQPVAKIRIAAKASGKIETPAAAEAADAPEAPAADVAEASDAPDLAGPAMKKLAVKPVAQKPTAKLPNVNGDGMAEAADEPAAPVTEMADASAAEPAEQAPAAKKAKVFADKAPVQTQPAAKMASVKTVVIVPPKAENVAQADDPADVVSPAAGKVVSSAKMKTKLAVAAAVTEPQAEPAPETGTTQAESVATVEGGEGGGMEAMPPAAPLKKAAAIAVKKALVTAAADSLPTATASEPAAAETAEANTGTAASATAEAAAEDATSNTQLASLKVPANPAPGKNCKVFTASYGGGKSVLIRSLEGDRTRFTALTVNEAKAETQAKAFINVYAKGGEKIAEFGTQNEALTQAFQLCPEG